MKILWFTDLHLVGQGRKLNGVDPCARFSKCMDAAIQAHSDAELVVVTGDLAHAGAEAAYQELDGLLRLCPIPHRLIAGNHDDPEQLAATFYAKTHYSAATQHQECRGDYNLIYINTNPPGRARCGMEDLQLEWLSRQRLNGDKLRSEWLHRHSPRLLCPRWAKSG